MLNQSDTAIDARAVSRNSNDLGQGDGRVRVARLSFLQDQEIFPQEVPATRLYRVLSGAVRTVRLLCDGRRQIGAFHFPGDWFGLSADGAHRFGAEAVSDAVVEAYPRSVLTLGGAAGPCAGPENAIVLQLARAEDHLLLLGRKTAEERVAAFLCDLNARGIRELPMRRQDIADYLGLTIETVSRMLSHLQRSGLVEIAHSRSLRILKEDALSTLAA